MSVPEDPNAWRQRAACREHDPELFFPSPRNIRSRETPLRICRGCPVISECQAEATRVRATYGIWAGKFINQVDRYHSDAIGPLRPHGTLAAHRRHQRHNEEPCLACKDAWNTAKLARYRKSVERRANR